MTVFNRETGLIRGVALAFIVTLLAAGAGYGASSGSQTVTITVAAAIDITVPPTATIGPVAPPNSGTTTTTINVKSNKAYNLQVRSEPVTYPNGKAKNSGGTELFNPLEWTGDGGTTYANLTASYVNVFGSSQPKTTGAGVNHTVGYRQTIDYSDDPDTYTIVVQYLGVQP